MKFFLLLMTLGLIILSSNFIYSQELPKIRAKKKRILKHIKEYKKDIKKLKKRLNSFDRVFLESFLRDYDLSTKGKKKADLIKRIVENIHFFLSDKKSLTFKSTEKESAKKSPTDKKKKKDRAKIKRRRDDAKELESKKKDDFIRFKAESIVATREPDVKGYKRVFLFAKVEVMFRNKTLYADAVTIKLDKNDDPVEVMAVGNLLLEDSKKNRITGKKIYYFPQIQRAIIYDAVALNKPFFLTGKKIHQVDSSKYIIYDGIMTTCNLANPHYGMTYSKAWYYDGQQMWAANVEYQVGGTTLLYLPFFFRSMESTGIKTAFGYEKGIGWFMHNTWVYKSKEDHYAMTIKGDYYQRMGIYLGYEFLYKKGTDMFSFDSAIAIDRSLKYVGGDDVFTNYFDQDGDGVPDESNNFRWRVKIDGSHGLFSSSDGLNSAIAYGFKTQGEPYFQSQFESRRKLDFDMWELLTLPTNALLGETTEQAMEGAGSGFGSTTGQEIYFSLKNKLKGLSVNISGNFTFLLQRDDTNLLSPPNNPYKTSSYKNYKHITTFPQIDIAFADTFQIIGKDKPKTVAQKKSEQDKAKKQEETYQKEILQDGQYKTLAQTTEDSSSSSQNLDKDEYLPPEVKRKNKLVMNLPFIYSLGLNFAEKKYYNTGTDNSLSSDIFNTSANLSINTPFTLTYRFLTFKVTNSGSIKNFTQKTKNASAEQDATDDELTYTSWNTTLGGELEFHFFDEYKYLELIFGGGVTWSKSDRFDKIVYSSGTYQNEAGRSEALSVQASVTFLKTKFAIAFADNLYISAANQALIDAGTTTEDTVLKDQKGNLVFTTHSETFSFLTIDNSYTYSRRYNLDVSNLLSLNFKILDRHHLFGPLYLNSLTHSVSWYHDFQNPRGSYLTSTFAINFNLTKDWSFIYQATSANKQLYRYSDSLSQRYGYSGSRNFFEDLLDSFNFFDKSKRERSYFNLEKMTFKLQHDLHDWMMEFRVDLYLKQFNNGPYYFEPTLYFVIYLKALPSFRYPKIKHSFTKG